MCIVNSVNRLNPYLISTDRSFLGGRHSILLGAFLEQVHINSNAEVRMNSYLDMHAIADSHITYRYTYLREHIHIHIHTYYNHTNTYTYMHIHIQYMLYIHTYMHSIYTYSFIHNHIYMHISKPRYQSYLPKRPYCDTSNNNKFASPMEN